MVAITMYDTHAAVKRLEAVGFSASQAETLVAEHVKVVDEGGVATKQDIKDLQQATKQDIKDLQQATKQDIKDLQQATKQDIQELRQEVTQQRQDIKQEMKDLEMRLMVRLSAVMVVLITILFAALKFTT